ncbi:MAG: DNA polymerase III subunit alpha [Vicingaceae bacterium]
MYLVFDTETTGLPRNFKAPLTDFDNWPRLVQLAWQLHDEDGSLMEVKNFIVRPEGFTIPFNAEKIHGISTDRALKQGIPLRKVIEEFAKSVQAADYLVGHNVEFDKMIVGCEFLRETNNNAIEGHKSIDTKDRSTEYCAIPGGKGGKYKWPKLEELHRKLFGEDFGSAHNAAADVEATARCFLELLRIGVIGRESIDRDASYFEEFKRNNSSAIQAIGLNIEPYQALEADMDQSFEEVPDNEDESEEEVDVMPVKDANAKGSFSHLHCHSRFSVLQATCEIKEMVNTAVEMGMPALALTDKGNMFGAFKFHKAAMEKGIKPIIGCEFNLCLDHTDKSRQDNGSAQVLLAKNKEGYINLCKMNAVAFISGFYYVPRIDKEVLKNHKNGLIATSSGLRGEVSELLLNQGDKQAEEAFKWWVDEFGEDFYVELVRHGLDEEKVMEDFLLKMAKKHKVKVMAANNVFYVQQEDANAHDILMCVKDGEQQSTPIGKGRGFRFGFPNQEYYFKSSDQMAEMFGDIPQAIANIAEIVEKVEEYPLKRDVLLPAFQIPDDFTDQDDYLKHLAYKGAEVRYGEINDVIKERLDFELETIKKTGYPGYFLIVQDFTREARNMGVSVGPGRGSAAGSVVAYCIGITNVDPIKYDLLFERFLNPDRVSLPDIDIDFDDEGRSKVIDFVVEKYGKSQVAQIITYGSMAAKSAIRDTARVLDLPLGDADQLAKLMPDAPLKKVLELEEKELKKKLSSDQFALAQQIRKIAAGNDLKAQTLQQAAILEGSLRNTGTHACGIIITPEDMTALIPVASAKDAELMVTQYDNSVIESAGMLKMDFLGLKTLSIINDAIAIIKQRHGIEIDPDKIPLDDEKTYELYQRGETNGTFQFESGGMQKHLKHLKPDKFGDLIAMNALYRPGPMEYIPNFIKRKHGQEKISYDIPDMEEYLAETYGITVYQEQVMLLSQKLAGFSKGDADILRKAMGKKIFALLEELKPKFLDGCENNGHDRKVAEKVWKDWEAFAAYAFNKSHSTCYSVIAFHTAYLKANYPAEYMASVLTNNMSDIKKVAFFMDECRRLGVKVLGPDVNESVSKFTVNKNGEIRFGMGAVKGVGESAVENIVSTRSDSGFYSSLFDLASRVDLRAVNKRTFESLAQAGAFDSFQEGHRAQYLAEDTNGKNAIESAIRFANGAKQRENASQINMFGESEDAGIAEPGLPDVPHWNTTNLLAREKEVVGVYISGHPLDDYKLEIESFCNANLQDMNQKEFHRGRELKIGGMVTRSEHKTSKKGKPYGRLALEDYTDSSEILLFSDDYVKFKDYLVVGWQLFIQGKVQPRPYHDDELEFKISRIELLSDLREKMAKSLTIHLPDNIISEELVNKLDKLSRAHKGKCQLKFNVIDTLTTESLPLVSRSQKVDISDELISEIDQLKEINYTIN